MSRRTLLTLLTVLLLAAPVFAQLPVGRVIPTDNFTVGHATSVTHVALIASGHANVVREHVSAALRTIVVAQCGPGAALAIGTNPDRRDLILQNGGTTSTTGNIWIGFGTQGHVALTAATGFVLHTNSAFANASPTTRLVLPNYRGPIACIGETAGSPLLIMEILR